MRQNFQWQWLSSLALMLLILMIIVSESSDWVASAISANPPKGKTCIVLVLGYPSKSDGAPDPIQELRVAAGVKAYRNNSCSQIVFSGAAVKNQMVEAETMAKLARSSGVKSDRMLIETQAQNTWENVKLSTPFLEKYDSILIASDSLHAQRGRRYLCKQRPDLCAQTFVTAEYRPLDHWWWKIATALNELFSWGRDILLFSD
jgi:vancomycin permeability regulator SanA